MTDVEGRNSQHTERLASKKILAHSLSLLGRTMHHRRAQCVCQNYRSSTLMNLDHHLGSSFVPSAMVLASACTSASSATSILRSVHNPSCIFVSRLGVSFDLGEVLDNAQNSRNLTHIGAWRRILRRWVMYGLASSRQKTHLYTQLLDILNS